MDRILATTLSFILFFLFLAFSPFQMAQAGKDDEVIELSTPLKKRRIIPSEKNSQANQEVIIRANSLGSLSVFPDELLDYIFDSLIPEHSNIARVSQLFRLHAYNAPYWKGLCKMGGLNLAEAKDTSAFLYFKSQANHKPEVALLWAPHLERFPFTEGDKERNAVSFALYKKVAEEGSSEDLKALGRLHIAWMGIQGYTEAISMPGILKILDDEYEVHGTLEKLIREQNPHLAYEEADEQAYQTHKDRFDFFNCLIAILNSNGYDQELPVSYGGIGPEDLFKELQRTMENEKLPRQIRRYVKYLIARPIVEEIDEDGGEFDIFSTQDMFKTFMSTSLHYPQEAPMARFLAAKLRALSFIESQDFSDEESSKILKETTERGENLTAIKYFHIYLNEIKYLLAKMRVEDRTNEISDDMALTFLNEINNEGAQILKAVLRAESRIPLESLTDEEAAKILADYVNNIHDAFKKALNREAHEVISNGLNYSERWSVPLNYIYIAQLIMFGERRSDKKIDSMGVKTYQDAFPALFNMLRFNTSNSLNERKKARLRNILKKMLDDKIDEMRS